MLREKDSMRHTCVASRYDEPAHFRVSPVHPTQFRDTNSCGVAVENLGDVPLLEGLAL